MAAVAGLRGTGDFGTDERPKNFREMILWLNPNGSSPIFGLTSKIRKRTVDDPDYSWWDEPNDLVRLQINGAAAAGDSVLTVDSSDPSSSTLDNNWGLATHLKPGDVLMVEPSADAASFTPEYVRVDNVLSTTQIQVTRGFMGSTAGSISDNAYLLLISSAYAEGTASPEAVSRNPVKYGNLIQIFKDSYELTGTTEKTRFRTGDPWSHDKKRKMFDHARSIEWSMLFGRKAEVTGPNGKPLRTMDGIRRQIPASRTTIFTNTLEWNNLLDALYRVFDYESPAGDERIAFCGNVALNTLNKMIALGKNSPTLNINWGAPVKAYGMNLRELILPQGRILLRTHPLLNRHASYVSGTYTPGIYSKSMWVLDFSSLTYVTMKGRDTRTKDDVQQKDEDLRRGFIQSDCSIEVDRGGLTCAYIGGLDPASFTP